MGLKAKTPHSEAGIVSEPIVSVPRAKGASPAATAAALPEDDSPAERSRAKGLPVRPPRGEKPGSSSVEPAEAHTDMFVLAIGTAPAARTVATTAASWVAGAENTREPAADAHPVTS